VRVRTTLTIDDDLAVLIQQLRTERRASFKDVVNMLLREGLRAVEQPRRTSAFRTRAVALGGMRLPDVDDVAGTLAAVDGDAFR
jgi:hypothetical protein